MPQKRAGERKDKVIDWERSNVHSSKRFAHHTCIALGSAAHNVPFSERSTLTVALRWQCWCHYLHVFVLGDSYKVLCFISLEKPVSFSIWFACKLYIHVGSSIAIVTMLMCIAAITIKVLRHLQVRMWSIVFEPISPHSTVFYTARQIRLSTMVFNFHAGYGVGITLVLWLTTWLGFTFGSMSIKLSRPVSHKLRGENPENLAIKFMQPIYPNQMLWLRFSSLHVSMQLLLKGGVYFIGKPADMQWCWIRYVHMIQ